MLGRIGSLRTLCFALLILASYPLAAQRDTATLEGRIVDVTGAVVANASVTATNTSTNFSYHAKSDSEGAWTSVLSASAHTKLLSPRLASSKPLPGQSP